MVNQHLLLRKISVIHAIKCNSSDSFKEAISSFEKLDELKLRVLNTTEFQLETISKEIDVWAGASPIVSPSEINSLMSKNHLNIEISS